MTNTSFAQQTENSLPSCLLVLRKRVAFTLAEVLITLGIIGVVAALTIPNLIANYQKQQTVAKLKKTYSLLNQAIKMEIVKNGGDLSTWHVQEGGGYGSGDPGLDYLIPHLNVVSKFSRATMYHKGKYNIYKANGDGASQYYLACENTSPYAYILNDGTIILFVNFLNYYPMSNALYILVDLNGFKGPNRLGRDVFVFIWTKSKPDMITFSGAGKTVEQLLASGNACPAKGVVSGYQGYVGTECSTIIMKDGWEIKDHYPWW